MAIVVAAASVIVTEPVAFTKMDTPSGMPFGRTRVPEAIVATPRSIPRRSNVPPEPGSAMVCAGSDGTNAARQIARIATGWRLRPVADPLIVCTHAQTPEAILAPKQIGPADLERCRALGEAMAAGLGMGVF